MAKIPNFPSIRPSLLLDFANSGQVDPRMASTRATTATRRNQVGKIESVAAGVPRIDYDPFTGECLGLLMEEARTNLLTHSNNFSDASWVKTRATTAPSTDGWTHLIEDTTPGATHLLSKSISAAPSTTYTWGIDLKAGARKFAGVEWGTFANQEAPFSIRINLETGAVTGGSAGLYTVDRLSDGWRVSITTTTKAGITTGISCTVYPTSTAGQSGYDGDGVSGIYVRYADAAVGAFPASYIPTTTAAVTRAADTFVINDIAPWFNPLEGTFLVGFRHFNGSASDITILCIDNGTTDQAEQHVIRTSGAGATIRYTPRAQGAAVADIGFLNATLGSNVNAAASYGANVFTGAGNGVAPVELTRTVQPAGLTRLRFGQRGTESAVRMTGHFRFLAYWPKKLTNDQIQRLTA